MTWKMSFGRSTPKALKNSISRRYARLDEDQDERDDQAVDADRLGQRQAEDVRDEDRARRLGVAPQGLHRLAEADAEADAGTDGAQHGEPGGKGFDVTFHFVSIPPCGARSTQAWI